MFDLYLNATQRGQDDVSRAIMKLYGERRYGPK